MSLASVSIRNPVFAWMLMLGLIVFGVISFNRLGVSQYPDVNYPVISIQATLEGAAPEVMESDVVDLLEDAVMAVEGVREVSSTCRQGSANVTVEFELSRDIDLALQDVQARVSQAGRRLPKDMDPPVISKTNPEDQPILQLALSGTRSPQELSDYANNVIRDQFLTVPGVGEVRLGGYLARNIRIWMKADALREHGLAADEVIKAIQAQHVELPAGRIEGPNRVANVRVEGEALDIDQWRNLQISKRGQAPVYLKDVALVENGFEDHVREMRSSGIPAQSLQIVKQRGANAVDVAKQARARLAEIQKTLPSGMNLEVRFDGTVYIADAIQEIEFSLALAVLLTAVVCWVFLGSLSSTMNVILAIPVSIFGTFAAMYFCGFTLNSFTLLALSLSIGIVVDDAIMVLENIYRHAEKGKDRVTAARVGTEQITFAALAATLAIIAIFLPVAFMSGVIGKFFFQFGVVLSIAVFISLLEALTFAPARCAQFLTVGQRSSWIERTMGSAFELCARLYHRVLRVALRWRLSVLLIAFSLFGVSLFIVKRVPAEFIPPQDQGYFLVRVVTPPGSSFDYTNEVMRKIEQKLSGVKEVRNYLAIAGMQDLNSGMMFVMLVDAKDRKLSQQELMVKLRPEFNVFPGTRISFQDTSQASFSASRGMPIEFSVKGPDWDKLAETANSIMDGMKASGTMVDVDTDYNVGLPEVKVVPDRVKALVCDVNMQSVATAVNSLIGGQKIATYENNGRRYDVRMRLVQEDRMRPEDIGKLYVRSNKGALVPLSEVTNVKVEPSLQSITRKQRQRAITVFANPAPGVSQDQAMKVVEQLASNLPDGYSVAFSGSSKVFQESMSSLFFAMALGLMVAYMVLGSQFNSFIHPVTVLLALPFSVTGALLAIWLTGNTINIFSFIGIILLMGIVKKNSILLVDYTNQMRAEKGMSRDEALLHACPVRLRPILMTTIAMIAGSLPGAIKLGPGGELRVPMSVAVIGGLIVSTLLTLVVVPCFYSIIDQVLVAIKGLIFKGKPSKAKPLPAPSPESPETVESLGK